MKAHLINAHKHLTLMGPPLSFAVPKLKSRTPVESKCRRGCQPRDEHLIATWPSSTAQTTHAAENARLNRLPGDWRRACTLMSRPGGRHHIQAARPGTVAEHWN